MLKFYVLLVLLCRAYGDVLYADSGGNVTLRCVYTSSASHLNWYKQVPGEPPQIVSSFYKHHADSRTFHKQFKDNKRFSVHTEEGLYNLKISDVRDSDSALYYCGYTSVSITEFKNGTFLLLKNSSCKTFLRQPDSVSAQPGGSVTLSCTILTGTVNGGHSVHWFRKNSEGSGLGTLYTTKRSSGPCARSPEDGPAVHRCVYSLPRRNVTMSDAGMYHCAVASCGQILFGPGTRLNVGEKHPDPALMHGGAASLAASLILNIILMFVICRHSRRKISHSEGSHQDSGNAADPQDEVLTAIHYAALDFKLKPDTKNRQKNREEEPVYSRVKHSNQK